MQDFNVTVSAIFANLIGGLIFFWVDRFIFTSPYLAPRWEGREKVQCADSGDIAKGFRLVRARNYDRTGDPNPEFRCEKCSERRRRELKLRRIKTE